MRFLLTFCNYDLAQQQQQQMLQHVLLLLITMLSAAATSHAALHDTGAQAALGPADNTHQALQLQAALPTVADQLSAGSRTPTAVRHLHSITNISLAGSRRPPAAAPPLTRHIVPDFTQYLQTELAAHNISVLLVVSNPTSHSSSASSINGLKIEWNSLTVLRKAYFFSSYKEFQRKWSTYLLLYYDIPDVHHHHHLTRTAEAAAQQQLDSKTASAGMSLGQQQQVRNQQSHAPGSKHQQAEASRAAFHSHHLKNGSLWHLTRAQQHHHHSVHIHPAVAALRVAIMSVMVDGRVGLKQLHLAEAVSLRIRSLHKLSLDYSTWSDKGDSLITFTPDGKAQSAAFLATTVHRDAFNRIYHHKVWGSEGGGSGLGSTLNYTMNIRQQLPKLIAKYNISSMLDSSCGSMHWMPMVVQEATQARPDFKFMGSDVVCSLIEKHKASFANRTNMQFQCIDYSNQNLPAGYDLVFSRDSLQHVPQHATWMFLNNVKASGARYLLVGSYVSGKNANARDIVGGGYYDIDLTRPPFNVWPPVEVINEQTADGKHMLLFDMRSVTWTDDLQGLA